MPPSRRAESAVGRGLAIALAILAMSAITPTTTGQSLSDEPLPTPDHGVNASTHSTLWSGDRDTGSQTAIADADNETALMRALAATTDIPLDGPPEAVERWNRGEHRQFPDTDRNTSVYPPHVSRWNGSYIADAYLAVFTVQPSTVIHASPQSSSRYVARTGSILATTDYRVVVPEQTATNTTQTNWTVTSHGLSEIRFLIDDEVVNRTSHPDTHTPSLSYQLDGAAGTRHELTVEADLSVTLQNHTRTCHNVTANGSCVGWNSSIQYRHETRTLRDSVSVVIYDPEITGEYAPFPDGDVGLSLSASQPWFRYAGPRGDVRSVWWLFSARDPNWDVLVRQTASNVSRGVSPLRPLQVHAYPSETGVTTSVGVTHLDTRGQTTHPPRLPANVHVDVATTPYTPTETVTVRLPGAGRQLFVPAGNDTLSNSSVNASVSGVVHGLVRGVNTEISMEHFTEKPLSQSRLSLTILETTPETATVEVRLENAETGAPIATADRDGVVVVQGQTVNTDQDGLATVTVPRSPGGVVARYEPADWWTQTQRGYVGDSTLVRVEYPGLDTASVLYNLVIAIGLFLLGVFLLDRSTRLRAWPPWRLL